MAHAQDESSCSAAGCVLAGWSRPDPHGSCARVHAGPGPAHAPPLLYLLSRGPQAARQGGSSGYLFQIPIAHAPHAAASRDGHIGQGNLADRANIPRLLGEEWIVSDVKVVKQV